VYCNKIILFFAFLAYINALGADGRPIILGSDDRRSKEKDNGSFARVIIEEVTVSDTTVRSKEEITNVFLSRFLGARSLYDKYLNSGLAFAGKITLKLEIEADGSVSQVSVISSDTNKPKFDDEVKNEVKTWRIRGIEKGSVTVIVPFEFHIFPFM